MTLTSDKMFQCNVSTAIILMSTTLTTADLMFVTGHFLCRKVILTAYISCRSPLGLTSLFSQ